MGSEKEQEHGSKAEKTGEIR
uniref:Uncharacterized protein n=1 Tax=Anguilla anguilla TaxID=7936 RepID=A0A0E9Q2K8_ANGAN